MRGFGNITGPSERVNRGALLGAALLLLACKALLLAGVELGKDEAAYWYWARHHLGASYAFVLFAVIRFADAVLPSADLFLRLPILLGSVGSAWLLFAACRRQSLAPADRLIAVVTFVTSHWAWHTGSFLHPDGVLVPIWLLTLACAHRADRTGEKSDWLLTGVLAGLTGLCKYSGCVLAAGLLLALALRWRRSGLGPLLWCALPCAVVASPLILALWELNFHLPFTLGSLSQVAADRSIVWRGGLFLLAPLLYISPPLLLLLYAGIHRAWTRRAEEGVDLLLVPALSLVGTFAFFALVNGQVKGNWILPGLLGLWPLAFHDLHRRRSHCLWRVALLVIGIGQAAVPATTVRWPTLAQLLVASSPDSINATYPSIVSPTDLPREPTFSWTERVCEYHGWQDFGRRLVVRLEEQGLAVPRISSAEYGVGFGLGRYLPSQPEVTIVDDERFAHIADVQEGETSIYVARAGSRLPRSASQRQAGNLDQIDRRRDGCGSVSYEISMLTPGPSGSLPGP